MSGPRRSPLPFLVPALVVTEDAPTGASVLTLADLGELAEGDRVVVTRPCTEAWIAALKMNTSPEKYANLRITWLNGSRELVWHRRLAAVDRQRNQITLNAPITTALERRFGAGTVAKVAGDGPMTQVGIEELTLESAFDPARSKDEDHSWIGLAIDETEDAWVRT